MLLSFPCGRQFSLAFQVSFFIIFFILKVLNEWSGKEKKNQRIRMLDRNLFRKRIVWTFQCIGAHRKPSGQS